MTPIIYEEKVEKSKMNERSDLIGEGRVSRESKEYLLQ